MGYRQWACVALGALVLTLAGGACSSSGGGEGSQAGEEADPTDPSRSTEPPAVELTGPELPEVPVAETLTSRIQPGWSVDVRGVVRGPGELSTLLLDLHRDGSADDWPQGLGSDDYNQGLGGVSVIDRVAEVRYRMVGDEEGALSSGDSWYPGDGGTTPVYAVFRALDPETTEVTVEVPTFGRVEHVPVVDWDTDTDADAGVDDSHGVRSTMRLRGDAGLRMDVLAVGRLGDDDGTLVRARLVNEDGPDPAQTTFGTEGNGNDLCHMEITDPSSGDYLWSLEPCYASQFSGPLARGEQAVYEVRFPELPEGVDEVVFSGGGYFPSAPIPVEDDIDVWELDFPHEGGEPRGGTLVIPEGTPDGEETTTRTGDTVEVELAADVLFEFDSARLTPAASDRITSLADRIGDQARAGTVTITGYTDDVGDEAYNQALSEQRAESVRAALEPAIGRSDLSFEVSGRGEADPAAPNQINGTDNPDGRARNRRVTIRYEAE
jgi:outer membrane protein OmpA-like peptidoglycan-associated protein